MADTSKTSTGPRLKADGTPFAKRGEGAVAKRPAYIAYKATGPDGAPVNVALTIVSVTRKAEELLALVDGDKDVKYIRTEI